MAVYLRSRFKTGKHSSVNVVNRVGGKGGGGLLAILLLPITLLVLCYKWLIKGCIWLWKLCPNVWKCVFAAVLLITGIGILAGGLKNFEGFSAIGAAIACALWAEAGFDKKRQASVNVSESDAPEA